ncbi:restriction endonuclease subunit S [Myroides sp. C15-4]|uniref:restriction endonuclease subunit S n=1 Tax=Myroides sp. C15-4 TaxID=3400532 RepID=UPI003D2F6996
MEKSKLNNWVKFLFPKIFIIKKGFYNKKPDNKHNNPTIPFLGATAFNNGISTFYNIKDIDEASKVGYGKNEDLNRKIFEGKSIVVTNNGSVGHSYYQHIPYTCSHDINPLYLKGRKLNVFLGSFIITCIEQQKVCFEYARKWRPKRMIKSNILLPTQADRMPDYEYMESYSKKIFQQKQDEYLAYIQNRVTQLANTPKPIALEEKEWEVFKTTTIFDMIQRGKRLKKDDHIMGEVPYASSTSLNNGIDDFIGNEIGVRLFDNCLTLANSGSVGCTFYQPFKVIASDHVTMLQNKTFNKYVYLFMASMLTRLSEKYSFNREINDTRLSKEKIMLPITAEGSPDYEYMEQYMKYQEYQKLKDYLEFKK